MDRSTNQPQPKKIETLTKGPYWAERKDDGSKTVLPIRQVACGLAHTIALDVDGTLHSVRPLPVPTQVAALLACRRSRPVPAAC